jgi:hypothetical protein
MILYVGDLVRIRRSNGEFQVATVKYVNIDGIYVQFMSNNEICLKGPIQPEHVRLIERKSNGLCSKARSQIFVLLLKCKTRYVFFFFSMCLFINGIYSNYCAIAEAKRSSGFFSFSPPSPSIWKATLTTLADIPRTIAKVFGFVLGDFSSACFDNFGNGEKLLATLFTVFFFVKIIALRFLTLF